ncbi:SGNH hydrolase domain-containing protein [Mesorhizobium sp. M1143]|uniref:SGNH hydrolase domain-containing protein n=1 Tax=Mesorhizobium sp. M1143 TaxID=2957061 RepID=UPI003337F4E3
MRPEAHRSRQRCQRRRGAQHRARRAGASYIDMTSQFCNAKTCHVFINGKIAYRDQHHLATPFAETLEPAVERALF